MVSRHSAILFNLIKEGDPTICDDMDGPWSYYAKWNKWGQILLWFHLPKVPKIVKLVEAENWAVVARGEVEAGSYCSMAMKLPLHKINKL